MCERVCVKGSVCARGKERVRERVCESVCERVVRVSVCL
jgi:hypothetical protein